jgi:tetratricopeptide (TPR) repeat protein
MVTEIDILLRKGLVAYGKGLYDNAIGFWKQVLEREPNNQCAIDYLESAGVEITPSESVKDLVAQGLTHFSGQNFEAARTAWESALKVDPNDSRAQSFLQVMRTQAASDGATGKTAADSGSSTAKVAEPDDSGSKSNIIDKAEIIGLLQQKKFNEVLERLYAARAANSEDDTIARSITLVENRLTMEFSNDLGDLDQIPVLSKPLDQMLDLNISKEEVFLFSQMDSTISLQDIVSLSMLDNFNTFRFLHQYIEEGIIVLQPE